MGVLETDREPAGGFRAELVAAASGNRRGSSVGGNNAETPDRNTSYCKITTQQNNDFVFFHGDDNKLTEGVTSCKLDVSS